jgi:hypothetical protein
MGGTNGHAAEAWDVYWSRIGGFGNLGQRLRAYERGERICRAFAGGGMRSPEPLSERQRSQLVNEWGLYLMYLGCIEAAVLCYRRAIAINGGAEDWTNASIDYQNLSGALVLAEDLRTCPGHPAYEPATP